VAEPNWTDQKERREKLKDKIDCIKIERKDYRKLTKKTSELAQGSL
jgi:hypothetical protein